MGLVSAARTVFELDKQDELAFSAPLIEFLTIQLNCDCGQQALMPGKLVSGNADRPTNLGLPAFHEPMLERNAGQYRVQGATLSKHLESGGNNG